MKQRFFRISILLFLLSAFSQNLIAQHSGAILWEISGKNLKEKSYLFGTIHIQDERVFQFSDKILAAFDSCDAFAMEVILDEVDAETTQNAILLEEGTIKDIISEEDYALLDAYFKEKAGTSVALYVKLKPFFLYSQLSQLDMEMDMEMALDMHLLQKAREEGKATYSIEKFEEQVAAIDKISLEDQAKLLMDEVKKEDKEDGDEGENETEKLIQAYLDADLDKMIELLADTTLPAEFNQAFVIDRNKVMCKRIIKMIKKESCFCAVGAAHLGGKDGLIELLRAKGYTVKPIK
jgi:uncharacterized protein YbaP (TraB family)